MQGNVRSWFNNAVLTVGVPFEPGQTAASRPVTLYEDKVGEKEKRREGRGGEGVLCLTWTCVYVYVRTNSHSFIHNTHANV